MLPGFVLYVTKTGEASSEEHRLSSLPITIGRNADNHVRVIDQFVSGCHARIEELNGELCVRDLDSRNGVFVPTHGGIKTRVGSQFPYQLSACGGEFFLGSNVHVRVEADGVAFQAFDSVSDHGLAPIGIADRYEWEKGPMAEPFPPPLQAPSALQGAASGFGAPVQRATPGFGAPLPELPPIELNPGFAPAGAAATPPPMPGRSGNRRDQTPESAADPAAGQGFAPVGALEGWLPAPAAADVGARRGLGTDSFHLTTESLALQGLRELVASLTPDRTLETKGDVARLVTNLHNVVDVVCRCFISLSQGYGKFKGTMKLDAYGPARSPGFDRARDPSPLAGLLLDFREGAPDATQTLESSLDDLAFHQVAVLDAMFRAARALVDELSPANIARASGDKRSKLGLRERSLWQAYCEHHQKLSEDDGFRRVFAEQFASAYAEFRRRRGNRP